MRLCPLICILASTLGTLAPTLAQAAGPTPSELEFFESKIRPILVNHCYNCHSSQSEKLKGALLLDTKAGMHKGGDSGKPVIIPGDPDSSPLIIAVRYTNEDLQMPPKKRLGAQQVRDLETWVRMGAPDPRTGADPAGVAALAATNHWSFQLIQNPPSPSVKDRAWAKNSIDHFSLSTLEAKRLKPSPQADRRTLIRRLTFDLHGLPPTHEQVQAFLNDTSPDAYEKLVDRLLASPHYGERYARHWLDLARYSDTKGYVYDREEKRFVHSHVYRDWVVQSLNDDLPYDQFLLKQIAADLLNPSPSPGTPGEGRGEGSATSNSQPATNNSADLAALGFLTIGRRFLGIPQDIIDDRIDVVTRTTQALTVACARCHDHKFDPIPTADYYSLYGVFASCMERTVPIGPEPPKTEQYAEYEKEFAKRQEKYEAVMKKHRDAIAGRLRSQTWQYFQALPDAEKTDPELFYETIFDDSVNPVIVRQWHAYVLQAKSRFDPIFTPYVELASLPSKDFAAEAENVLAKLSAHEKNKVHPKVVKFLATTRPSNMKDVAGAYGKLFDDTYKSWKATQKSDPKATALPDPADEALRKILYSPDSPAQIPPGTYADIEHFFTEAAREEVGKAQGEVDRLIITAPAARRHALILMDRPSDTLIEPRIFKRGNPAIKGEAVPRQYLSIIARENRKPFTQGSGRLELAQSIIAKDNPLTARVMANRIWLWHFGQGLVRTPSDFGTRSDPPTHPQLLDHLATRFMEDGYSMKKLHRLIVTSATYRQSSAPLSPSPGTPGEGRGEGLTSSDPENLYLARQNPRRLDFESMRDALLAASGELDLTLGGRAVDMFKPPYSTRRSIYGHIDRQFVPGILKAFDFANPDLHSPQRFETSIPQQSLFFLNSPFILGRAKALAKRTESTKDPTERIRAMHHLAYQRDPTGEQTTLALNFITSAAADPTPPPLPPVSAAWQYGYGEFDQAASKLKSFKKLPHFQNNAYQGGPAWPDEKLGWVQLTATGGHSGNDLQHAAIRRFIAPRDTTLSISGTLTHSHDAGDGIRASILSSRHGQLASFLLHNQKADTNLGPIELKKGDNLDFLVDFRNNLNSDDFTWPITLKSADKPTTGTEEEKATTWDSKKDFGPPPSAAPKPLTPWERYAQILLSSNEFLFID